MIWILKGSCFAIINACKTIFWMIKSRQLDLTTATKQGMPILNQSLEVKSLVKQVRMEK